MRSASPSRLVATVQKEERHCCQGVSLGENGDGVFTRQPARTVWEPTPWLLCELHLLSKEVLDGVFGLYSLAHLGCQVSVLTTERLRVYSS